MKLTLEQLWKLADLVEEQDTSQLSDKIQTPVSDRVIKLPRLQISENWGKLNTVERNELESVVNTATKGVTDPFSKLRAIQQQMGKIASGEAVKNPRRILSQIIILETLNRMFKSFQPNAAGFVNEAFLSVIYGSTQKEAIKANLEGDIGDITDSGIPVSIKTLTSSKALVKGSVKNLIKSINLHGKVFFDVYLKLSDGDGTVGKITVSRFTVDATNINDFLRLPQNTIALDASGKLIQPSFKVQEGFVHLLNEQETEIKTNNDSDSKQQAILRKTMFEIPQSHWSQFVENEKLTLEFSDERISKIIQNAVQTIDSSITEIFNNLANFTESLQTYLTSVESGRAAQGQKALEISKQLQPSTEKVVKATQSVD